MHNWATYFAILALATLAVIFHEPLRSEMQLVQRTLAQRSFSAVKGQQGPRRANMVHAAAGAVVPQPISAGVPELAAAKYSKELDAACYAVRLASKLCRVRGVQRAPSATAASRCRQLADALVVEPRQTA